LGKTSAKPDARSMTSDPICWYSIHQPLRYLLQCRRAAA
jgi:hypothetical protein